MSGITVGGSKFSMSQFELENAIREATRMDSSINKAAGFGKQRKALENTNASFNISEYLN